MKCSGCGKEVEKIASGYGNNFDGPKQFCDYCTDNHPDGVMKRMERAMQLRWPTTPQVDVTKIVGRNESCPCGSGKKFKKCCQRPLGKASGMSREQFSEELTRNLPGLRYLGCDPDATLPDGRKCSAFGFGPGAIDDPEIQ